MLSDLYYNGCHVVIKNFGRKCFETVVRKEHIERQFWIEVGTFVAHGNFLNKTIVSFIFFVHF